jgi:hypothetical protein
MNYKYPPIYKYGLFFIAIYMFLKHQQLMTPDKLLVNSVVIALMIAIIDYIIIDNHPGIFEKKQQKSNVENFKEEINDQEIEEIINAYDMSIMQELEDEEHDNF